MLILCRKNHLLIPGTSQPDIQLKRRRAASNARHEVWLDVYFLTISDWLVNIEGGQGYRNSEADA